MAVRCCALFCYYVMNAERTFAARLKALAQKGFEPTYVVAVLDLLETTLLDYQTTLMMDKDMPPDEKGRHAMLITAQVNAVRKARLEVPSLKTQLEAPKRQLHNTHLQ